MAGLADAPDRGRPPTVSDKTRERVIAGVSAGTVHKLWQANAIEPHLTRTFFIRLDVANLPRSEAE